MDADEIKRRLQEAGVPLGAWDETCGGPRRLPDVFARQRDALLAAKTFLEQQVRQDRAKVAELREKLVRLKYGGGR